MTAENKEPPIDYDMLTRKRMAIANPAAAFFERAFFGFLTMPTRDFNNMVASVLNHVKEYEKAEEARLMSYKFRWLEQRR